MVLITGHQVRCILREQVAISKQGIVFMRIKFLRIEYILWRLFTAKSMFDVADMPKNLLRCANE